jgi:thiol-disulfide isomerase/thioredoxin
MRIQANWVVDGDRVIRTKLIYRFCRFIWYLLAGRPGATSKSIPPPEGTVMTHLTRRNALLGTLGICFGTGNLTWGGKPENEAITWQKSLKDAHKLAVQQNKPMMLVFGAEWCGFCKKMEKTTLNNPQLAKYINGTFVSVHIDVDDEEQVAKILDVKSLPCTIILSPEADLLGRFEGFMQPAPMYQKLVSAKKLHTETHVQTAGGSHSQAR